LPASTRADLLGRLRELPAWFGRPHAHGGVGLRQLKPGCYEVRISLEVRAVLLREGGNLVVAIVGNHDAIRRWLKSA
jgi:hypothetical protein